MVGSCTKAATRCGLVTTQLCRLPVPICSAATLTVLEVHETSPLTKSAKASDAPLYETWVMFKPVRPAKSALAKWPPPPIPVNFS
jgi:hypothetical protein